MKRKEMTIPSRAGVIINRSFLRSEESSRGKLEPNSAHYSQISRELMYVPQTLWTSPSRKMKMTETFACPWILKPKVEFINICMRTVGHMTSCQVKGLVSSQPQRENKQSLPFPSARFISALWFTDSVESQRFYLHQFWMQFVSSSTKLWPQKHKDEYLSSGCPTDAHENT